MKFPVFLKKLFCCLFIGLSNVPLFSQELRLSVADKKYGPDEPVWVSIAVVDSSKVPGAFNLSLEFDQNFLKSRGALAPENSLFKMAPAITNKEGLIKLAGFQGVTQKFKQSYTLLCVLSFQALDKEKIIDQSLFKWQTTKVYTAKGKSLPVIPTINNSPVMQSQVYQGGGLGPYFKMTGRYLRFNLPQTAKATLTLYNAAGRASAVLFKDKSLPVGTHAWPVNQPLSNGTYIAILKGENFRYTGKLGVAQ